jgi:hypothetical protein
MRVAIMQPYFCPYLGYFQLMSGVDRFVLLDDVNFIVRGWINRNQILMNQAAHMFTVPVLGASQNERICDLHLSDDTVWRAHLLKKVQQAYARAPHVEPTMTLLESVLRCEDINLAGFVGHSVRVLSKQLGLDCEILQSSALMPRTELRGQERIIALCKTLGATSYLNPPGGRSLYRVEDFRQNGISLEFLDPQLIPYQQFEHPFVPGLSVIDALMFNSAEAVREKLLPCRIQPPAGTNPLTP